MSKSSAISVQDRNAIERAMQAWNAMSDRHRKYLGTVYPNHSPAVIMRQLGHRIPKEIKA